MNILSIDSTTNLYFLGLYINGNIFKFTDKCNLNYLDKILYNIDIFLKKHKISIKNINYIICVCGPGNFTSTKIGICIAEGLSLGMNIPIIKISSLESLAEGSFKFIKNNKYKIISIIKGYSKLIYWSLFYISNDNICKSIFSSIKLSYICEILDYLHNYNVKYIISGSAYKKYINKIINYNINLIFSGINIQRIEDTISLSLKLIKLNKNYNNYKKIYLN